MESMGVIWVELLNLKILKSVTTRYLLFPSLHDWTNVTQESWVMVCFANTNFPQLCWTKAKMEGAER